MVVPKMPKRKSTGPRNGRLRRYCSQRCRQAAYRARHAPSRQALEESITDGLQELRFLPRLSAEEIGQVDDTDLAALAQYVGRARAMHEKILAALPDLEPVSEAASPVSAVPPPMVGAQHRPLPYPDEEVVPQPQVAQTPAAAPEPVGRAPVRRADGSYAPTPEQEAIITAAAEGQHLVVEAGAGTGKTSTLVLAARAMPRRRALYIAFNRSIAREAQAKMPDNVTASTAHSLAFRAVGRRYKDRLDGPRVPAVKAAAHLGITRDFIVGELRLTPAKQAVLAQETVGRFCYSADRDITTGHVPFIKGIAPGERDLLARHLVPLARRAWEDLQRTSGKLKFGHDHYLKIWQLSEPSLSADVVFLDEGQDSNQVLVDVIRGQDAQQIVVGDSCQPPGTMVTVVTEQSRNTRWDGGRPALTRQVPIEEVREGDLVVSYNIAGRYVHRNGSPVQGISARPFHGSLVRITDQQGRTSRYTPDHHCVVRFGDDIADKHIVYMMRKGDDYRVGVTGGRLQSQQKRLGLVLRALAEDADAAWIVSVHDTRAQAATAEAITSWTHGVPDVMFRAAGHSMGQDGVEEFWRKMGGNREQAAALLAAHGRDIDFPLWRRGERLQTRRAFVTRACNLIDGMEALPLTEEMLNDGHAVSRKSWVPFTVTSEAYSGPVWSMTVEKDHTYVGDGIFTHNCQQLYSWRGAEDALANWPAQQRLQLTQSWRFGPAIAAEANTWLAELGSPMRLTGNPAKNSVIGPLGSGPRTVLCRTNATAMGRAMAALADGERAAIVGGTTSMRRLAEAARDLQAGRATSHPELFAFENWGQVRSYVEDQPEEAGELATFVELIDDHGAEEIITATGRLGNEKGARRLFSTAHKAKGREWANVEVADDFREPKPGQKVGRADAMLSYVTVTRAMDRLNNAGLAWIHERREPSGPRTGGGLGHDYLWIT